MFKSLVILFEKKNELSICGEYLAELQALKTKFLDHKVEVSWLFLEDAPDELMRQVRDNIQHLRLEYKDCLHITDNPAYLELLKLWGYYAVAFLHKENIGIMFKNTSYVIEGIEGLEYNYLNQVYKRLAGLPWDILETRRLKVRESTVEDVEEFYRIYKEPSITYYMDDLFEDPEMERSYMKNYIRRIYGFYEYGLWTVILKETKQIIGRAGLSVRDGYELAELGFVISKQHQRNGYAKEVCEAILEYAREMLHMEGVQALVLANNEASVMLLKKLGFYYQEDVMEETKVYQLWVRMFSCT